MRSTKAPQVAVCALHPPLRNLLVGHVRFREVDESLVGHDRDLARRRGVCLAVAQPCVGGEPPVEDSRVVVQLVSLEHFVDGQYDHVGSAVGPELEGREDRVLTVLQTEEMGHLRVDAVRLDLLDGEHGALQQSLHDHGRQPLAERLVLVRGHGKDLAWRQVVALVVSQAGDIGVGGDGGHGYSLVSVLRGCWSVAKSRCARPHSIYLLGR